MKTNRVRQVADLNSRGLPLRIREVITKNPYTTTAYGLWTFGTGLAVTLALRGQSKGEKYSKVISQGTLSALAAHLTSTGLSVMDESSDNLAQNVASKLNTFLKDTSCSSVSITSTSSSSSSGSFSATVNIFSISFSLTTAEMKIIVNGTNTEIYNTIKGPLTENNITSTFTNGVLTLKYGDNNICS